MSRNMNAHLVKILRETIEETIPKKKNLFVNGRSISEEKPNSCIKDNIKEYASIVRASRQEKEEKNGKKRFKNAVKNDYRRRVSRWTECRNRKTKKGI